MTSLSSSIVALKPGAILGGCRIDREIGSGGMGRVFLAEHLALKRLVAIKTILPDLLDARGIERFLKEARLCSRVDHPNVVVIHDVGQQGRVHYIIMQYVEGKTLTEYMADQGGPLPWRVALRVLRPAAKGLAAVHKQGLVHRDIKPSNVMVSYEGRVLLMDFGLVRDTADATLTEAGAVVGTPKFMSPEQCQGRPVGPASDIFSLGSALYYLLTNRSPFPGPDARAVLFRILEGRPPRPIRSINPEVPPEVAELVARAMAFDPKARFPDALAMSHAMGALLQRPDPPAPAPTIPAIQPTPATKAPPGPATTAGLAASLAPLELVPEELSTVGPRSSRRAVAVGVAGIVLGLALMSVTSGLFSDGAGAGSPPGSTRLVLRPAPSGAPGRSGPTRPGMVLVRGGRTQLGVTREQIRAHLIRLGVDDEQTIQQFIEQPYWSRPQEAVIADFLIDDHEVTNAEYYEFVKAKPYPPPPDWGGPRPPEVALDLPVTGISVEDAKQYAASVNKSLPTVAQWMRAFHGGSDHLFPWGDDWEADRANVKENPGSSRKWSVWGTPRDVGDLPIHNLVGNVREMTGDTARLDDGETVYVIKGAYWAGDDGSISGVGAFWSHMAPGDASDHVGIRCVAEAR